MSRLRTTLKPKIYTLDATTQDTSCKMSESCSAGSVGKSREDCVGEEWGPNNYGIFYTFTANGGIDRNGGKCVSS